MKHSYWLLLGILFFAACRKENAETLNQTKATLFQAISAGKQFSLYQAALKRAGMFNIETFSNGGPLTVFAPTDSAFLRAGLTLDSINRYQPDSLANVLKYAIIYGRISSASLVGFYSETPVSLNAAARPMLIKNYYGIYLDGIPLITNGSQDLADGALHTLDRVPFPPSGSLYQLISKAPDLSLFTAVINRVGYVNKLDMKPAITASNPEGFYTVFVPTDAAFKALGLPDADAINQADFTFLQSLADRHIRDQKLTTANMKGGYSFTYQYYYVDVDGFTVISTGNLTPCKIIRPDNIATNGVMHVLDQVVAAPYVN